MACRGAESVGLTSRRGLGRNKKVRPHGFRRDTAAHMAPPRAGQRDEWLDGVFRFRRSGRADAVNVGLDGIVPGVPSARSAPTSSGRRTRPLDSPQPARSSIQNRPRPRHVQTAPAAPPTPALPLPSPLPPSAHVVGRAGSCGARYRSTSTQERGRPNRCDVHER
ncbi:hypothetical protein BD413DRAFT_576451 [Trametes elegans]|nr:hypothetical protein BD413DRAFT_576451 [Trametes elegans]